MNTFSKLFTGAFGGFHFILSACLLAPLAFSSLADADMAAMEDVKLSDIISAHQKPSAKRLAPKKEGISYMPTLKETSVERWAVFARDAMGMKTVSVVAGGAPQEVSSEEIQSNVQSKIISLKWEKLTDKKALTMIKEWRDTLKTKFSTDSYYWAWTLFQLDEKEEAKTVLQAAFNKTYENNMKLEFAHYGFGEAPLEKAQKIHEALAPLVSKDEKAKLDEKMKQMKVKIANLPDSQIMT